MHLPLILLALATAQASAVEAMMLTVGSEGSATMSVTVNGFPVGSGSGSGRRTASDHRTATITPFLQPGANQVAWTWAGDEKLTSGFLRVERRPLGSSTGAVLVEHRFGAGNRGSIAIGTAGAAKLTFLQGGIVSGGPDDGGLFFAISQQGSVIEARLSTPPSFPLVAVESVSVMGDLPAGTSLALACAEADGVYGPERAFSGAGTGATTIFQSGSPGAELTALAQVRLAFSGDLSGRVRGIEVVCRGAPSPASGSLVLDLAEGFTPAWATGAPVTALGADDREQMVAAVRQLGAALEAGDYATVRALLALKIRDQAAFFGRPEDEIAQGMESHLRSVVSGPVQRPAAAADCAFVQVNDRTWRVQLAGGAAPLASSGQDAGMGRFRYRFLPCFSRIGGAWHIVM